MSQSQEKQVVPEANPAVRLQMWDRLALGLGLFFLGGLVCFLAILCGGGTSDSALQGAVPVSVMFFITSLMVPLSRRQAVWVIGAISILLISLFFLFLILNRLAPVPVS